MRGFAQLGGWRGGGGTRIRGEVYDWGTDGERGRGGRGGSRNLAHKAKQYRSTCWWTGWGGGGNIITKRTGYPFADASELTRPIVSSTILLAFHPSRSLLA